MLSVKKKYLRKKYFFKSSDSEFEVVYAFKFDVHQAYVTSQLLKNLTKDVKSTLHGSEEMINNFRKQLTTPLIPNFHPAPLFLRINLNNSYSDKTF